MRRFPVIFFTSCFCLFLKKVDSIFTLKINNSISVRNQLTLLLAKVDMFPEMVDSFPEKVDFVRI